MIPAVVVGCYTMALPVVRSLGRRGVPVIALCYDPNSIVQGSRYTNASLSVPHPEREEGRFVERLVELAVRFPGAALIPTSDASLSAVSRNWSILEGLYRVAAADWSSTELFIDKRATYRLVPEVLDPGRSMVRGLGFTGFSCAEFKTDPRDRSVKLMEVNGRHNLSSQLAVALGIDFPWIHYRYLVSGEVPGGARGFEEGVYWIDLYRDIITSLRSWRSEDLALRDYVRPYLASHVFAIASVRDPKPFLHRSTDMMRRASEHVFTRRSRV